MPKKILVIGASGLVGSTFVKYASKNFELHLVNHKTSFSFKNFPVSFVDLTKKKSGITDLIHDFKPDFVVNTVAYPNVDFCETNQELANILHVESTHEISDACNRIGSRMIYFSTDAVFDGIKSKKYVEEDPTNPLSYYGKTKLKAEKILLETNSHIVIRTTVIYGWHLKSRFTNWVLDSLKSSKPVSAFTDQHNTPTLIDDLVKSMLKFFEKDIHGLYHAVGKTCLSRYEFSLKLAKKFGYDEKLIIPTISKDKNQIAPRPLNGCLDNSKLENEIDFQFSDINSGIEQIFQQSKN
jgi:dTDP-4-dehydrorhamnose reductase